MRYRIALGVVIAICAFVLFKLLIGNSTVALLMPAGPVAAAQRNLIVEMVLIMLVVVIPMFVLLFTFAHKYRADNPDAKYDPDKSHNPKSELLLWIAPILVVAVLWILTWNSAHALDPYAPLQSPNPPLTIQVIALQWKWLFIYPQQDIATVNFIEFPVDTPVHFELTADAPMSSFWIPQLGSQIYAMAAMQTQLNLMADEQGEFTGKDTEINGAGYAGMTFIAKSTSQADFDNWVEQVKSASSTLDLDAYNSLAEPSEYNPSSTYSSVEPGLFDNIVMKYMIPTSTNSGQAVSSTETMPGMQMMPGMHM